MLALVCRAGEAGAGSLQAVTTATATSSKGTPTHTADAPRYLHGGVIERITTTQCGVRVSRWTFQHKQGSCAAPLAEQSSRHITGISCPSRTVA
jgi:hypothetical protein